MGCAEPRGSRFLCCKMGRRREDVGRYNQEEEKAAATLYSFIQLEVKREEKKK